MSTHGEARVSARLALRSRRILCAVSGVRAIGASVSTFACCFGHVRFKGFWRQAAGTAPAAGFPRIRFYIQSTTFALNLEPGITAYNFVLDANDSTDVLWTWDLPILGPYVSFEWTNGGAVAESSGYGELLPSGE